MNIGHVDLNKLNGIGEKGLGLLRELLGSLIGNDSLEESGRDQQKKGEEKLQALRKEAEAQRAETRADLAEQRQKAAARSRRSA